MNMREFIPVSFAIVCLNIAKTLLGEPFDQLQFFGFKYDSINYHQ